MKLTTSRILAQLSEQDRNHVEMELAGLNGRKQQIIQRREQTLACINQLNQQRDQALKYRNTASLLQAFDLSLHEQQSLLAAIGVAMAEVEKQQQTLLSRYAEVYRTHHAYERIHDKQQRRHRRVHEHKTQRQLDDMAATRASLPAT